MCKLFKASGIDGFNKTALFDPFFKGDNFTFKNIFFKDLKKLRWVEVCSSKWKKMSILS